MPDWSIIDYGLGRDQHADDEPTMDEHERVGAAADGGAGGWEAFDEPDSRPGRGPGGGEAFDHGRTADESPIEVPARAYEVANYARMHSDAPPPGFKGNREYVNEDGRLPEGGDYREYDIDPKVQGFPRSGERIVVDRNTGESWYTPDHYATFKKME
jgi:ribonuclease